jgi:predicted phosphodiesterase
MWIFANATRGIHACAVWFAVIALLLSAKPADGQPLTPAWVELGEGGKMMARIVVAAPTDCPAIFINALKRPMSVRQPIPAGFRPVCEFEIPPGMKSATVNLHPLILPKPGPQRVAVIGDSGCRIKGKRVQDCNDTGVWPFRNIAASTESEKPDLVIHVGDYLYRENPCPAGSEAMCGGTPAGDNWDAWNADFFTPATRLLAGAPWIFTRGNHENCDRSWRGWFYYLDPRPWDGECQEFTPPYIVKLGDFEAAIIDTSAIREDDLDEKQVAAYAAELRSLHPDGAWLVTHYPFWGFKTDPHGGPPVSLVSSLQAAWEEVAPKGYDLILSGHVHLFEYVSVDHGRPPQLVAGDAGTAMAVPLQMTVTGTQIRGASVVASQSQQQFGYTLLRRSGKLWKLELKNQHRDVLVSCAVPDTSASCEASGTD